MTWYHSIWIVFCRSHVFALRTGFLSWTEVTTNQRRSTSIPICWSGVVSSCFVPFIFLSRSFGFIRCMTHLTMSRHRMETILVLFMTEITCFERIWYFWMKVMIGTGLMSWSLISCWRKMFDTRFIDLSTKQNRDFSNNTKIFI